jgi:spoIIIJ-associated protein
MEAYNSNVTTSKPISIETIEQGAEIALEHLNQILKLGSLDATARIESIDGETVTLEASGADAGLLIGRRGQTLHALQHLLLVMMTHTEAAPPGFRLTLDADSYRKRRQAALEELARALAIQVSESGEEAVLEPLNALERRIVHTVLADNPDVETYSEGEGLERHVVISPRHQ